MAFDKRKGMDRRDSIHTVSDMSVIELLYQAAIEKTASRVLIINAHAHVLLSDLDQITERFDLMQHFKPEHESINQMGLEAATSLTKADNLYELVLLLPSKNKQQSLGWMAEAMQKLRPGGAMIMACGNKYGAKSYESALQSLAGNIRSRSKSKCRLFSANKTPSLDHALLTQWISASQAQASAAHGLVSQPGLFSWDHTDIGSQLLIDHLPHKLSGTGMDLCCGYGFLAHHILRTSPEINMLHLLEADSLALDCARQNCADWQHQIQPHWQDAARDRLPQALDWIVCNPPFHTGQTRDVELGQDIVRRACQTLKRRGRLYIVANRKLPYEALMQSELSHCQTIIEANGFKIIQGVR